MIKRAVVLAGGMGMQMMPYTKVVAKEMLLLGCRPVLEHVVDELVGYGIEEIFVVVSPGKGCVKEYFGDSVIYVTQEEAGGMVQALMLVEEMVKGGSFVLALGDTVVLGTEGMKSPISRVEYFCEPHKGDARCMGVVVEQIEIGRASDQGIMRPFVWNGFCFRADMAVEKPSFDECPRPPYAIAGRYVFNDTIFDLMRRSGGNDLTEAIQLGISEEYVVWCAPLVEGEKRFDIGTFPSYIEAFREITK